MGSGETHKGHNIPGKVSNKEDLEQFGANRVPLGQVSNLTPLNQASIPEPESLMRDFPLKSPDVSKEGVREEAK